jgi:phage gp36-like protein
MYSIVNDLIERLSESELIDLASETENLDAGALAIINTCIADADVEIDSFLAPLYPTPLNPVPPLITKISAELAIVNLYKKRNIFSENVTDRYKWVSDMLKSLASGVTSLDITPDESADDIVLYSEPKRGW